MGSSVPTAQVYPELRGSRFPGKRRETLGSVNQNVSKQSMSEMGISS